jgi:predicted dehydrogenase
VNVLRLGMIGGGRGAFIGEVHRKAAALDGQLALVAGAFSSDAERSRASGRELGLEDRRIYASWRQMLDGELALEASERIDAVSIVTPNATHFEIAHAFAAAGIHVVCDKPLCVSVDEARRLITIVEETGVVFGVTYNYSGYPLIKQMRHMVASGGIGQVRKVVVEYTQGWLASPLEQTGQKQAAWRQDPKTAGPGGAIADIGTHAEHLARYITGLELESLCADLTTFVPGRRLDDDAAILLRYQGGARGVLTCTQIAQGYENDLKIRIHGTDGSLAWRQESPNELVYRSASGPEQVLRHGQTYLCPEARLATRLPPGHPEGFLEAFANVYLGVAAAIRAKGGAAGAASGAALDHPTVYDGARGVWFIEKAVESSRSDRKWVDARWKDR